MVVKRQCSFCAAEIEPGTGSMYVKRDGTVFHFCSSSCRKQQLHLGRVGHRFKWTRAHALKVAADRASPAKAPAFRVRKGGAPGRPAPTRRAPISEESPVPPGPEATEPAAAPGAEPARAAEAPAKRPPRARKKPGSSPPKA
jgi:large subunit ribosomal protein L24e